MTAGPRIVDHYFRPLADGRILCEVCPRICNLGPGERGHCDVRQNRDGHTILTTDGRATVFRVEPIEAMGLSHFLPGAPTLAFGAPRASPETIALAASELGCACIALTDDDPAFYYEYAIDIAEACRARRIKTLARTAGFVSPGPRAEFFAAIDAANVDLKAFTERFYWRRAGEHLDAVLETLKYLRDETDVWLEITTQLVAGENDSEGEIDAMTRWIAAELGDETPLHFTALDDGMLDRAPTLLRARAQAKANGLRHVYVSDGETTLCAGCGAPLIAREGRRLTRYALDAEGACRNCSRMLAGQFAAAAGASDGRRAVDVERFA